jgi:beta-lactamase class A
MQSVFKAPLALAAFHLIESGKLSLDRLVHFGSGDRILPRTWSPLQQKYPEAEVDIPLRELMRLAVSDSDNTAADLVLRTIGGPAVLDRYMKDLGITGFHIEDNEAALHRDVAAQYRNWFEPAAAVQFLQRAESNPLLMEWMRDSTRANGRIRGQLPEGTIVMHKPGTSGTATNDIGLITLPDGRRLAIAVFVTDSTADEATRDAVIARIARAAYDAAIVR